jgi:type IV pilus assembly protein PilY1
MVPFYSDRTGTSAQQYWNPRNDPANWQHMVNFTIGIGLTSTLNVTSPVNISWGGSTYAAPGFTNLSTTGSWPTTGSNVSPGNVYDLWHAAINSRGQAFSIENPLQAEAALQTSLNRILATTAASAALATNSTRLATGTLLFQAAFYSGDWTGLLKAIQVNPDGSIGSTLWNATDAGNIPSYNSRNIVSWSGSQGINFTKSDLQNANLWSYINNDNLLNYLRGDPTNEIKNTGGIYRSRQTALGDIVNSDPVFVSAENYGYTDLPEGSAFSSTSYSDYLTNTKQTRRKMVYLGANDGMLHGFDALTGAERFAFVPKAVIPNMAALSDPFYVHHYYVDGPPGAWDAFIGGAWKTILVGTTGAGAKSVFALDITNPDAFGASKVMWEINDSTAQRSCDNGDPSYANNLGYTIGQGVAVKLNSGDWAVVFGNGYQSNNAHAVLYVVRAADGCLLKKIDTGSGSSSNPNGLGTPTLWDADGNDVYDYIYAPDLRGNIWKFDLSGNSVGSWSIANSGQPLFKARNATGAVEWTTARVELGPPPPGKSGVIVLFGTGRFFTDTDKGDTTPQSFYGIWDNGTPVTTTDRSELVQQTISLVTINVGGVPTQVRTVTANTIDWSTKRGWYMDLPTSGERVIGTAAVRTGRVIFTTMFPSSTDPCDFGGGGWLMEVDARTGGLLPYTVFDTTRNGTIDDNDAKIAGMPLTVGMVKQPLVIDGSPNAIKAMSGSSGQVQVEKNRSFSKALGRDSWRELSR